MPKGLRVTCRFAAVASTLLLGVPAAAAASAPPPTLTLAHVTVDRVAGTVDARLRICFSAGPRAVIEISERRTVDGVRKASRRWSPRGVEPRRISPYACKDRWRLNWLLERGLAGPGTYSATIRLRDAYGRWTPAVAFAVSSR